MESLLSEQQRLVRDTARDFAQKRLAAVAQDIEDSHKFPKDLFKEMGELGLFGLAIPEKYGGSDAGFLASMLAMEEVARVSGAVVLSYGAHAFLCARNLYQHANEAQRTKYLPKLVSGEWIGAFGLTEPEAGSDASGVQTKAVLKGDRYILNGSKIFITNGSIADVFIVVARTERKKGQGHLSTFIVEKGFKGFSAGRDMGKLGTHGSPFSELIFQDCEVPVENRIGEEGKGLNYMLQGLDMERVVFAGMPVGIAQAALDYALAYSLKRKQFKQPISSFQLVQEMLAQMATEIEASRLLSYQAGAMLDAGLPVSKQASFAKLFGAQTVLRATQSAIQILGGAGYTKECPVERYHRDGIMVSIGGGTSQIQTLIIARELIKEASRRR